MATEEEKRIISAFNIGYTMQKHEPELLDKILKSENSQSEYIKTLAAGKQQAQRDKILEQQKKLKYKQQERKPKR
jgi:hypothetical protein